MSRSPAEFIERDARAGFPRFPGMRLFGSIPVSQDVLNEVLSQTGHVPKGLRVEIRNGNRLVAHLGVVWATAIVHSPAALDGRTVTLEIASSIAAWAISRHLRPSFLTIAGRIITIDLARVPALAPWQASLAHLERIMFSSEPGVLTVGFEWRVPTAAKDDDTRAD